MAARQNLSLTIEGMHCGGCVNRVTTALNKIAGVTVERVEVGSALIQFDEETATPQAIVDAVNRTGFTARAAS